MTTQMNLINKIITFKSILLMSLSLSLPNALANESVSDKGDDDNTTFYASHTSLVNAENEWALSELSSSILDAEESQWMAGSSLRTYNTYDANTDTTSASVRLGASGSAFCYGGSNDQCGAQLFMGQTAVGGINNDSTINMTAATVRINGNVSLGSVGDNGSFVDDLADYVTTNRATTQTNVADIATNADGIAANVATLAVHEGLVTQNIADIATNASTLTAHTTAIGNLQSSYTNFQTETMNNFARMGSDMHTGLAEVTALSNVAYADEGWRASIGYGDYESKSATAVGISYARGKFKFKVSRSGKATGAGVAFDF